MAEMIRHTGILNNTGKNVVVVFMSLPDEPDAALVIDTDALPDSFNESLRKIVESVDGQAAENLADILARRMSPDGSNVTLLQKFHQSGRLQKVLVDNVTMTPRRGLNWPLRQILDAMKQQENEIPADLSDLDPETRAQVISEMGKFNVHAANMEGTTASGQQAEAVSLLEMAKLLEADANAKRQQAYKLDPSLLRKAKAADKGVTKAEAKAKIRTIHEFDAGDVSAEDAATLAEKFKTAVISKPKAKARSGDVLADNDKLIQRPIRKSRQKV